MIKTDKFLHRSWDEKQVIDWLHSIRCGQYEALFKGMGYFFVYLQIEQHTLDP